MTEQSGNEVKASHEEVEAFVGKLQTFYGGLQSSAERVMLESILESAQAGETGGYKGRWGHSVGPKWDDLTGWIEEQDEEDTQGFRRLRR